MEQIQRGSKGDAVRRAQKILGVKVDGDFGFMTLAAVKAFQRANNLDADGIVGPNTWAVLLEKEKNTNDLAGLIQVKPIAYNRMNRGGEKIKYIAVHYTAGRTSVKGTALAYRNNCNNNPKLNSSADFFVDDETIIQANDKLKEMACYSVGTKEGKKKLINNWNSVSIEMCSTLESGTNSACPNHAGWSVSPKVVENTIKLVKYLMKELNIPADNVVRHYDATGKLCPGIVGWNDAVLCDKTTGATTGKKNNSDEWKKFKAAIKA